MVEKDNVKNSRKTSRKTSFQKNAKSVLGDDQQMKTSETKKQNQTKDMLKSLIIPLEKVLSRTETQDIKFKYIQPQQTKIQKPVYELEKNLFSSPNDIFYNAAVATEVPLCSEIAVKILKRGGSAIDAGIAATLCVGLTNSFSSGIGGGGFALYKNEDNSLNFQVDFRETAPERIKEAFNIPNWSEKGPLSIGIPGEIMGLYEAKLMSVDSHLTWESLFEDVIKIAENGFYVSKELAKRIKKFEKEIEKDEGLRNTYFIDNKPAVWGDKIYRKNYAETLRKLSKDPMSFYKGSLMQDIVKFLNKAGSKIIEQDLREYKAIVYKSNSILKGTFKDYDVYTTNLPSGGAFLIFALNILENYDLEDLKQQSEGEQAQLLVEIMKYLFTRRGEFGDRPAEENKNLLEKITSKEYAKKIFRSIEANKNKKLEQKDYHIKASFSVDSGTSFVSVVDQRGGIFCVNISVNLEFGSLIMDPKTGIIFNNTMNDFYVSGQTNSYTINNMPSKNEPFPGKKPLSSMCPLIFERKDGEKIIVGGAGGTRIITSVLRTAFDILMGKTPKEAVSKPRLHHQMEPYIVQYEKNTPKNILDALVTKGNKIKESTTNSIFTSIQAMKISEMKIIAYSDERKGGQSAGF